jgi:hypothetical protein
MMKKILCLAPIVFCIPLYAGDLIKDHSVTVYNFSDLVKKVWVSGEEYNIKVNGAVRVPCYEGESLYVQSERNTDLLMCGEIKDINNEY